MGFLKRPRAPEGEVGQVIVGLGNPGPEYRDTRHNLGFMVVDELARRLGTRITVNQDKALVGLSRHPGEPDRRVLLAKPQTYMNLSGRAAAAIVRRHRLKPTEVWAVYDEMDIAFGRLRIRLGGSAGGHNGVASLIQDLGTKDFPRFRAGVGRPSSGDPVDYLLQPFDRDQRERVPELVDLAAGALEVALREGLETSMNRFNARSI
ncbi:MAG TPA: aminoacyl-tRNA hydrolase [Candidatus Dormibacteraeota bacterium]|nr:aminoacyl-tRNA hydrolase [Candidatus Dormibacteraeota bacterium]